MLEAILISLQMSMKNVDLAESSAALDRAVNSNVVYSAENVNAMTSNANVIPSQTNAVVNHSNALVNDVNAMTGDVNALIS